MAGLASDVDDVPALLDEQRNEAVTEVVGPNAGEPDGLAGASPDVAMPRLPVRVVPDATARVREGECIVVRTSLRIGARVHISTESGGAYLADKSRPHPCAEA